jgi:hypothetical protein
MNSDPSIEQLQEVIGILGSGDSDEATLAARVETLVKDPMLARRLIAWIPEVFGLVLISHLGKVKLPKSFSAKSSAGRWLELDLKLEPIFRSTLPLAAAMFHTGPRDTFRNIATRSSVLNAADNLLNAGANIDGATLSGPALIDIPAEVYERQPFWRRFLKWS